MIASAGHQILSLARRVQRQLRVQSHVSPHGSGGAQPGVQLRRLATAERDLRGENCAIPGCGSVARPLASGARERGFESRHSDQTPIAQLAAASDF